MCHDAKGPEGGHLPTKQHNRFECTWISKWVSEELNIA